jgi:hypothetical protein
MDPLELIDKQLQRLNDLFAESGVINAEQYVELAKPLQQALIELSVGK